MNDNAHLARPLPGVRPKGPVGRLLRRLGQVHPLVWLLITAAVLGVTVAVSPQSIFAVLWRSIVAQKFLLLLLAVLALTAVSMVWKTGQRIDVWVFMLVNRRGRRPHWLDRAMLAYTQLGNGITAYSVALLLFIFRRHMLAYELMFGTLTLWLTVELIKVLVSRSRPYSKIEGIRVIGHREGGHSFPSGHTSQAFFMASLLTHFFQAHFFASLGLYFAALLVGLTRIYVGMHYPRDVLGGAVLGTAWGLVGVILNSYLFAELNLH